MKLVIGYGISGRAAVQFLRRHGHEVLIVDRKPQEGVSLDSPDFPLVNIDQIILSPGVPPSHPLVQKARLLHIEVIGEIELAFRFLKNPCIGITGSNGKTTTALLLSHVLNSVHKKAIPLGNIGESLTTYQGDSSEILLVELSSFQLETLHTRGLDFALILNITPNHLDRYASMDDYVQAKAHIQHCLKPQGQLFLSQQVLSTYNSLFPTAKPLAEISDLGYTDLRALSRQSVEAAFTLSQQFGVTKNEFLRALSSFKKPAHRIEWVAEENGVSYYNDSKSSNIESVMHALSCFEGPVVLIAGGVHKGSSYKPWTAFHEKVSLLIAYGEAGPIMEKELSDSFCVRRVEKFADAVELARREAKKVVLLSPGCSSYDQFRNFEERGNVFKDLVRKK